MCAFAFHPTLLVRKKSQRQQARSADIRIQKESDMPNHCVVLVTSEQVSVN
jgi:hypothetical protein